MNVVCKYQSLLGALLFAWASLAQARTEPPICRPLVRSSAGFFLISPRGFPAVAFPQVEIAPGSEVAVSPDGRRIAFIPKSSPSDFVVMDSAGRKLEFPAAQPSSSLIHKPSTGAIDYANGPLLGIRWSTDNTIRLEKNAGKNAARFEFYKFAGKSNRLVEAAQPSYGVECAKSVAGKDVACVWAYSVEVNGRTVFSSGRSSKTHLIETTTLGVGDSASIDDTTGTHVQVMSTTGREMALRVSYATGNWDEQYISVGESMFVPDADGETLLEIQPVALGSTNNKVTLQIYSTPLSAVGMGAGVTWVEGKRHIVTLRKNSGGMELLLLSPNAPNGWQAVAQMPFSVKDDSVFMDPISDDEIYYQSDMQDGLVSLRNIHNFWTGFENIRVLPQKASLILGQKTFKLPVLTWACGPADANAR